MAYLTIPVKRTHINRGYKNVYSNDGCPIALAAQEALKNKNVLCLFDHLEVGAKKVRLPKSAQHLQRRIYDHTAKSELTPFSFRVRI